MSGVGLAGNGLASTAVAHSNTLLVALLGRGNGERSSGEQSLNEERGDEHGCYARAMGRGVSNLRAGRQSSRET